MGTVCEPGISHGYICILLYIISENTKITWEIRECHIQDFPKLFCILLCISNILQEYSGECLWLRLRQEDGWNPWPSHLEHETWHFGVHNEIRSKPIVADWKSALAGVDLSISSRSSR